MTITLHWQGACEIREDSTTRIGTLYLLDDALIFLEGGRLPRGGAQPALILLGLGVALAAVALGGGPAAGQEATMAAQALRIVVGASAAVFVVLSGLASRSRKRRDERLLDTLAEPVDIPSEQLLQDLLAQAEGSFSLPLADLRRAEPVGGRSLRVSSRLDDVYVLRVRPDRDRLVEALRPRLGTGEAGDGPGPA